MANPVRAKGSKLYLSVGLSKTEQVVISGTASGLDGFNLNPVEKQRDIPSGGDWMAKEALDYIEATCDFVVDENDTTRPLFWGRMLVGTITPMGREGMEEVCLRLSSRLSRLFRTTGRRSLYAGSLLMVLLTETLYEEPSLNPLKEVCANGH